MFNEEQTVKVVTASLLLAISLMWGALLLIHLIPQWSSITQIETPQVLRTRPPQRCPPDSSCSGAKDEKNQQACRPKPQTDSRTRSCTGCFSRVSERQYNYRQLLRHCLMVKRKRNLSTGLCRCVRRLPPPLRKCARCQRQTLHNRQQMALKQLKDEKLASQQGEQQKQSTLIFRKTGFREPL